MNLLGKAVKILFVNGSATDGVLTEWTEDQMVLSKETKTLVILNPNQHVLGIQIEHERSVQNYPQESRRDIPPPPKMPYDQRPKTPAEFKEWGKFRNNQLQDHRQEVSKYLQQLPPPPMQESSIYGQPDFAKSQSRNLSTAQTSRGQGRNSR